MRWILLLPILYLVAVLETSLADVLRVGSVGPDLLTLLALAWVLLGGGPRAFLVAGAIGMVGDLVAPGRPGVGMALLLGIGYGATRLRTRLPLDHPAWQLVVVWIGTTLFALGLALSNWLSGEMPVALTTLLVRGLGVGAYTAGVAVPVLLLAGWIREPFELRRKRLADLRS
jgi:cell shape-determining protein MreD